MYCIIVQDHNGYSQKLHAFFQTLSIQANPGFSIHFGSFCDKDIEGYQGRSVENVVKKP